MASKCAPLSSSFHTRAPDCMSAVTDRIHAISAASRAIACSSSNSTSLGRTSSSWAILSAPPGQPEGCLEGCDPSVEADYSPRQRRLCALLGDVPEEADRDPEDRRLI